VKTKSTRKRGTPKGTNKLATPTSSIGLINVTYENKYVLTIISMRLYLRLRKAASFIKLPKDIRGRPLRYNLPPKHRDRGLISKINIVEKASAIKATKEYAREFKHRPTSTVLSKECAAKARYILHGFRLKFDNTISLL
ncbi:hypothetical protein D6D23_10613, partial [Aureobasidium pullulans]